MQRIWELVLTNESTRKIHRSGTRIQCLGYPSNDLLHLTLWKFVEATVQFFHLLIFTVNPFFIWGPPVGAGASTGATPAVVVVVVLDR